MKFSTEGVEKMAEILVQEMNKIGMDGQGVREVEKTMRELVREVGAKRWGNIWKGRMNNCERKKWSAPVERQ